MAEEILVNVTPREVRVALVENKIVQEIFVERMVSQGTVGNIYKGHVNRILPGIQAAFVDIGVERAAFLHSSDIGDGTNPDIQRLLKVGQELLVQVYKDPLGSKGPRLTTQFTIPSRYLVFTPQIFQLAVSQKIASEAERERLLSMISIDKEGGFIFRTVAEDASESEIQADKTFLLTLWQEIKTRAQGAPIGMPVYEEIPMVLRVIRDLASHDIERIRIDDANTVEQVQVFAKRYIPKLAERLEFYPEKRPIFNIYSVEDELQKALERKIPLKSGGYLIFDQTEAMITIDVNTGSYVGHKDLEQTTYKTNLEAIETIARQIRLRNLGGIIIIDFIDMEEAGHKDKLLETLKITMAKDSARVEISELSSLGLVQLTRKRTRESLEHILCTTCPLCQRRGSIRSLITISYDIFREVQRTANLFPWDGFLVLAAKSVVDYLLEHESEMLMNLENQLGKTIKLRVELSYKQEQYDVLPLSKEESLSGSNG